MERFTSKPSKDNQRTCVTKNRLVFRQTSKEIAEALAKARMSPDCPRLAGKPRASSLVVDQGMNSMEVEEEGKRVGID
jgi:hypothetical protein